MLAIVQRVKGWLIVAALFIGGLVLAFWRGRRDGIAAQKKDQQVSDFHTHVEAEAKINAARQETNAMSDDAVDSDVDKWMRD